MIDSAFRDSREAWETKAKAFSFKGQGHRALHSFNSPFSLILLNLEGGKVQERKGSKDLDREVNHKPSRETQF